MRLIWTTLLLSVTGCQMAQVVPEASLAYVPAGEIQYLDSGATFDAVRVRNPRCNLSKRTDGSWGGSLGNQPIDASVTPKRMSGVGLTLSLEEESETGTVITGQWQGRIVRFEVGPEKALIRTPTRSLTLNRTGPTTFTYGALGELQLKGEASNPIPPWPEFALAMLCAFD